MTDTLNCLPYRATPDSRFVRSRGPKAAVMVEGRVGFYAPSALGDVVGALVADGLTVTVLPPATGAVVEDRPAAAEAVLLVLKARPGRYLMADDIARYAGIATSTARKHLARLVDEAAVLTGPAGSGTCYAHKSA